MISVETWYKTHNSELLPIVEMVKPWRYDLEDCKNEVFVLTDHNNICQFIDMKSLSFCPVWWAQELSQYHFRIDYY